MPDSVRNSAGASSATWSLLNANTTLFVAMASHAWNCMHGM